MRKITTIMQLRAFRIVLMQMLMTIGLAGFFFAIRGGLAGVSAIYGGIVSIVPTAVFASIFFSRTGASNAQRIVRSFYLGELLKFLLTAILFVFVFVELQFKPVPFFVAYVFAQGAYWVSASLTRV